MKPSDISCGLAHELAITLAKAGWEIPDIDVLTKNEDRCREILPFLRGNAKVTIVEHIIDCSAQPFCPDGWQILPPKEQIPTRFQGRLKWDKVAQTEMFHLSEKQTTGNKWIEGNELRKELVDKKIVALPANVLDYLLANPHLIPEEWKGKAVFFWGTIYRDSDGRLCVRCLYWRGSSWRWSYRWLGALSTRAILLRCLQVSTRFFVPLSCALRFDTWSFGLGHTFQPRTHTAGLNFFI